MSSRKWRELTNDADFLALFTGNRIVEATTSLDKAPYLAADIYWRLDDGRVLAMEVSTSSGCSTCGYGAGEKTYYVLD